MLNSIVGPPLKGVADFKSTENPAQGLGKDAKKAGSDSFGDVLKTTAKDRNEMKSERLESRKPLREKEPAEKSEKVVREDKRRPESEKADKTARDPEDRVSKKEKTGNQRQDAILKFMDSFESEFGVSPTRIVEAMANLQDGDLAASPEATADEVIGQLGLEDQQEDQAKEMYVGLLAQLAQMEKPAPILHPKVQPEAMYASNQMASGAQVMERSKDAFDKRNSLNQSLDSMNQKFWMNETPLADKLAHMNLQEKLMQPQGLQIDESLLAEAKPLEAPVQAPQDLAAQNAKLPEAAPETNPQEALAALMAAARAAQGKVDGVKEEASLDETAMPEIPKADGASQEAPTTLNADKNVVVNKDASASSNFQFRQHAESQSQNGEKGLGNTAKKEMAEKSKTVEKLDFKNVLGTEGLQAAPAPLRPETIANVSPTAGMQAPVNANPAEHEANVRQIMNQAQYLIKRGGGEMKVEMTPEGLGKIHMKVQVNDGKVNVQMAADTQEAKKTLESSLSDLKNSLAAHKLSMDHVKIDVVTGPNTDNSAQNQMNQNQSGSRDQTQKFWNNFNESFGSGNQQRSGFTDMPNLRGYARPRADKMLEPIQSAGVKKYAAAGKGNGLDLVA